MSFTVNPRGRRFEAYASAKVAGSLVRDRRSGFVSYEEAESWAILREAELAGVSPAGGNRPYTLLELGDRAMGDLWSDVSTPGDFRSTLRSFYDILGSDTKIWSLDAAAANRLQKEMLKNGNEPTTVNRKMKTLRTLTHWATSNGWMRGALQVTTLKAKTSRMRIPTKLEVTTMTDLLVGKNRSDYAHLVTVLAGTGLRVSEALRIKRADIHGTMLRVTSAKGGRQRSVPLIGSLRKLLEGMMVDTDEPFAHLRTSTLNGLWRSARSRMGLAADKEFVPHCLRHGVATRLCVEGVALPVVQAILGHANIQQTIRYVHVNPSMYEDARSVLEQW